MVCAQHTSDWQFSGLFQLQSAVRKTSSKAMTPSASARLWQISYGAYRQRRAFPMGYLRQETTTKMVHHTRSVFVRPAAGTFAARHRNYIYGPASKR